ncbi:MAG: ribosome-associated ATPase/putative transporter RbbA [Lautropia sp.]|nr:ribosome-associated ATPase/putative transporter RbbA [Lautropia sp.]
MQMPAVQLQGVSHRYGTQQALNVVSSILAPGQSIGLIGPDGVGKSTLLSLMAGIRTIQSGRVRVLGEDVAERAARDRLSYRVAFMPQGLGQNLYPTLSVMENVDFHARLYGLNRAARRQRIGWLLDATGLANFPDRPAGKLSGGMKQKLGLCCALVHSPELLILDEPTTGVDPLSRRQFWDLVGSLRTEQPGMTVIVATAYIDEAERFEHLLAMDDGHLIADAPTQQVLRDTGSQTLEEAYVKLLPENRRGTGVGLKIPAFIPDPALPPAMEAHGLTKRFGAFTAVDRVDFRIPQGEIFGFLGSNGCGKSTTMKMLTGLLPPTEGDASLLGRPTDASDLATRMRVGYMSQAFSLYKELTVRRNLQLHARLYQMSTAEGRKAIEAAMTRFELNDVADIKPEALPLGIRQRLQLAAACLHRPRVLILDEPTSGVDPVARQHFWTQLIDMSRRDRITIFVSTHFMNEAMLCDRISLMHQGRVLAVGTPRELCRRQGTDDLETAFIAYLEQNKPAELKSQGQRVPQARQSPIEPEPKPSEQHPSTEPARREMAVPGLSAAANQSLPNAHIRTGGGTGHSGPFTWLVLVWCFAVREYRELIRDRVRLFVVLLGPVLLMSASAVGVSFDMKDIRVHVLDRDGSVLSRELVRQFEGSPYFVVEEVHDGRAANRRLSSGRSRLTIEIPDGFGRYLEEGRRPEVGFIIDGAIPFTADNIKGFVQGIAADYSRARLHESGLTTPGAGGAAVEPRFVYNQDFRSVDAVAPGMIMLSLALIPVMMTALGVVREKEIGSIGNLYTSPASSLQFLLGKQLPYIGVSVLSYLILVWLTIVLFGVPLKGNFAAVTVGAVFQIFAATGMGLLISTFLRSQVAAVFASAIVAVIPAMNFSGLLYPVSTLDGVQYRVAWTFPGTWFQRISLGGFTKALGWSDFWLPYLALLLIGTCYVLLASRLLKKQTP